MLIRTVQLAIVTFWVAMTVMLVRVVYFPEETRLTEVPPAFVLARFLQQRATSELVILDRGTELGTLTVSPARFSEPDPETGATVELQFAGSVRLFLNPAEDEPTLVRYLSRVQLNRETEVVHLRFELRIPEVDSELAVRVRPQDGDVHYRLVRGGETVLDTDADPGELGQLGAQASLLLEGFGGGAGFGFLPAVPASAEGGPGGGDLEWQRAVGRHGMITMGGQRLSVYTLEVPLFADQPLTFFFTKSGELLKIEGVFGYEIISTVFHAPQTPATLGVPGAALTPTR